MIDMIQTNGKISSHKIPQYIYLCSFADSRLRPSLRRLKKQAQRFGVFQKIFLYNESDLSTDFKFRHKDKLILGSRGFGY
jgi:hypothetical protein